MNDVITTWSAVAKARYVDGLVEQMGATTIEGAIRRMSPSTGGTKSDIACRLVDAMYPHRCEVLFSAHPGHRMVIAVRFPADWDGDLEWALAEVEATLPHICPLGIWFKAAVFVDKRWV